MALPLLLFPSMVTSSLATALVPAISEAVAMKKKAVLQSTIGRAIQFSALIGIGATSLFLSFSEEIALTCYHMKDVGVLLKWLAVICPFLYLQNILTGTMNGLGMQKRTFQTNIIGSLLCIGTILMVVPQKGIIGFVLAMLLQSGFVCCRLLVYVLHFVDLKVDLNHWVLKPSIAAIVSAFIAITFNRCFFSIHFSLTLATICSLLTLGSTYLLCLMLIGSFSIKDIKDFLGAH